MIGFFEIGLDVRRQYSIAIKRTTGRHTHHEKCQRYQQKKRWYGGKDAFDDVGQHLGNLTQI